MSDAQDEYIQSLKDNVVDAARRWKRGHHLGEPCELADAVEKLDIAEEPDPWQILVDLVGRESMVRTGKFGPGCDWPKHWRKAIRAVEWHDGNRPI